MRMIKYSGCAIAATLVIAISSAIGISQTVNDDRFLLRGDDNTHLRCELVPDTRNWGQIACGIKCMTGLQTSCHVFGVQGGQCAMCSRCHSDDADGQSLGSLAAMPFPSMYKSGMWSLFCHGMDRWDSYIRNH